jgi:hypothetical protein
MRKTHAIAQFVTSAPESAREANAILALDHLPGRRAIIQGIYQDAFEVFAPRNFREACATIGPRQLRAAFVVWKSSGHEVLHFAAARARKVIVICESESEVWAVSEFWRTVFPEIPLEILRSADGRLSVGAVLRTLALPNQRSKTPLPPETGPAMTVPARDGLGWDVFLSVKRQDYPKVWGLYSFLTERGLKVFFAPASLPQLANSDYHAEIEQAVDDSRHMVVVASAAKYLYKTYVAYEFHMFHHELVSQRKTGNLLTLRSSDVLVEELPLSLRTREVILFQEENFARLLSYLQ